MTEMQIEGLCWAIGFTLLAAMPLFAAWAEYPTTTCQTKAQSVTSSANSAATAHKAGNG